MALAPSVEHGNAVRFWCSAGTLWVRRVAGWGWPPPDRTPDQATRRTQRVPALRQHNGRGKSHAKTYPALVTGTFAYFVVFASCPSSFRAFVVQMVVVQTCSPSFGGWGLHLWTP